MVDFSTINGTANSTIAKKQTAGATDNLSNNDFLNMFLTELKYQDPTKPMDADKMLDSTLKMSTISSNQKMVKGIDNINKKLDTSKDITNTLVSTIGKKIIIDNTSLNVSAGVGKVNYQTDKPYQGALTVLDKDNNIVKQIKISGEAGLQSTSITGIPDGKYTTDIILFDNKGKNMNFNQNLFSVIGMKKSNNSYQLKIADNFFVSFDDIKEILK